jgi:Putative restriction endonuclease
MSTIAPLESTTGIGVFEWVPSRLHRLSLDEFEAMVASGLFGDKSPIYLINGFLAEKIRDYARRDPGPSDIGLAVEVADSRLDDDRLQAAIYGAAGILFYWVVNVVDRQVEVYSGPTASGYAHREL